MLGCRSIDVSVYKGDILEFCKDGPELERSGSTGNGYRASVQASAALSQRHATMYNQSTLYETVMKLQHGPWLSDLELPGICVNIFSGRMTIEETHI